MAEDAHARRAEASLYEIRLAGRLDPRWTAWFDGMTLTAGGDSTTLHGVLADQAALHGVLRRIRDLGLPLVALRRLDAEPAHESP
ncbi:hypothetical protein [Pseudonocardia pini]|uniref:hypothetical protein n=1 Tax=Pseudonocardia pini TaxID=2758030 RepID=UPI0015F0CC42|nr:hypothetical protein [Pseudonocardia pini]